MQRDNGNRVRYFVDNSPGHLQRPGLYLKNLRDRGEMRGCDMNFLLEEGQREQMHSAIAGGHSSKLARLLSQSSLPLILDLSRYQAYSVRKVIDWMYSGTVEIRLELLADMLILCADLGVVFLHRQLEQTLRHQAQKGHLVPSINIASHPSTAVSTTTVFEMVRLVVAKQEKEPLSMNDIKALSIRSVAALVNSRLKTTEKAHLINVALVWLRHNSLYVEDVIQQISVSGMTESALHAFKMTLTSAMRNPNTRRNCSVYIKPGTDWLNISVHPSEVASSYCTTPATSESVESQNSQHLIGRSKRTQSELDELKALPTDEELFQSKHSLTSYTGSEGSSSLATKQRSFTRSEMRDIETIPDVFADNGGGAGFAKWERNQPGRQIDYSPSDIAHIRGLSDPFGGEKLSAGVRRDRSYTRSEMDDIRGLTDPFQQQKHGAREVDFSPSEISFIRGITDPFDQRTARVPAQHDRSFTRSEVEDIRGVPDVFKKVDLGGGETDPADPKERTTPSASQMSYTGSTASSISEGQLEEARQMQMRTVGKREDRQDDEAETRQLDISFAKTPKRVNSNYANVPKTASNSFYAC